MSDDKKIESSGGENPESTDPAVLNEIYYVHKSDLAVGDRKSEYFARLFRNAGKFKESKDCTSRIELHPLAAAAFPSLLDYMYAPEKELVITNNTSTALHYLGEYFEMRRLRWDAMKFIDNNLRIDNAEIYYEHAKVFQNETVLNVVAGYLGRNINFVDPESSIVKNSDPQLWVKSSDSVCVDDNSAKDWSVVVSQLGRHHLEVLDKETFQGLTRPAKMQKIDPEAALALCEVEDKLEEDDSESEGLTSLQERCASAFVMDFKKMLVCIKDEETLKNLENRKSAFLVNLLVKSLQTAETEVKKCEKIIRGFRPAPSYRFDSAKCSIPGEITYLNPSIKRMSSRASYRTGKAKCPAFYYDPSQA